MTMRATSTLEQTLFTSSVVPAGTVIVIAVKALATAFQGVPEIDATVEALVHEETAPAAIVTPAGTLATPVRSYFQTDSVGLKVKWPVTWVLRDARGVAWMQAVTW
jgi:hypothetical protein